MVLFHEVDLAVGDVLHIGEAILTVIDIEKDEVSFRVDNDESSNDDRLNGRSEKPSGSLPR